MQRSDDMLMAFWNPKIYRQLLKKDIKKRPFSPKVKKRCFEKHGMIIWKKARDQGVSMKNLRLTVSPLIMSKYVEDDVRQNHGSEGKHC